MLPSTEAALKKNLELRLSLELEICVPPRHYPGTLTPIPAVERLREIRNIMRNEVLALADNESL